MTLRLKFVVVLLFVLEGDFSDRPLESCPEAV